MSITVANWNDQKQAMIQALNPTDISEQPLSLEDIFLECTSQQDSLVNPLRGDIQHEINLDTHEA